MATMRDIIRMMFLISDISLVNISTLNWWGLIRQSIDIFDSYYQLYSFIATTYIIYKW